MNWLPILVVLLLAGCTSPPDGQLDEAAPADGVGSPRRETWFANQPSSFSQTPQEGAGCAVYLREEIPATQPWASAVHRARDPSSGHDGGRVQFEFHWMAAVNQEPMPAREFWVELRDQDRVLGRTEFSAHATNSIPAFFTSRPPPIQVDMEVQSFANGTVLSLQYGHVNAEADHSLCYGDWAPSVTLHTAT